MRPVNIKTHPTLPRFRSSGGNAKAIGQARKLLSKHHHFCYRLDSIDIDYRDGHLVISGRLPSFYLKQMLQTVLRNVPEVQQIDNHIDVVSCHGLSSVRHPASGEANQ